jgi:DNA-binding GntR family transcriptional regulator
MASRNSQLKLTDPAGGAVPRRRNCVNLFELAYDWIEELLVDCTLKAGRYLTMQDLQDVTGFGRTPVHHAVNRLATDTLILIHPRHGLEPGL